MFISLQIRWEEKYCQVLHPSIWCRGVGAVPVLPAPAEAGRAHAHPCQANPSGSGLCSAPCHEQGPLVSAPCPFPPLQLLHESPRPRRAQVGSVPPSQLQVRQESWLHPCFQSSIPALVLALGPSEKGKIVMVWSVPLGLSCINQIGVLERRGLHPGALCNPVLLWPLLLAQTLSLLPSAGCTMPGYPSTQQLIGNPRQCQRSAAEPGCGSSIWAAWRLPSPSTTVCTAEPEGPGHVSA